VPTSRRFAVPSRFAQDDMETAQLQPYSLSLWERVRVRVRPSAHISVRNVYLEKVESNTADGVPQLSLAATSCNYSSHKGFPRTLVTVIVLSLALVGCHVDTGPYILSEPVMGTFVEITVMPGPVTGDAIDAAIAKAFDEVRRVDRLMSTYIADSEVSQVNRLAPGETFELSRDTFRVIERGIEFNRTTHGAFDITVGPLAALWGFGSEGRDEYRVPTRPEIEQAMRHTGSGYITLDPDERTILLDRDGMYIDLSGIAKGYAVDRALAVLRDAGVKHALVNAGGDVASIGGKTERQPWTVGVQRPVRPAAEHGVEIIGTVPLFGGAVATSGNYQQQFTVGERTYSHIIDPRIGVPREHVPSVTVIAPDCTTADALATGLLVLGPEQGIALVESMPGVEALLFSDKNGTLTATGSSGWTAPIDLPNQ